MCILCGGPDWPTSVLCGILKLSVWQTLIGLTPVILLTAPTAIAGAFQLKQSLGGTWSSGATLLLAFCSMIQVG